MGTVQESWDRIHTWMSTHKPDMLKLLRDGVSEERIDYLEDALGLGQLPEDFKASYRIHDGATGVFLFSGETSSSFLSVSEIFAVWTNHKEHFEKRKIVNRKSGCPEKEVKNKLWTRGWIPFAIDVYGNNICLDLEPTSTGIYGQLISWRQRDYHVKHVTKLVDSFAIYLHDFANNVESGSYMLSEDGRNLMNNVHKLC